MKIAFILDPLPSLNADWDTTLSLMKECRRRGWKVHPFTLPDLHWKSGKLFAKSVPLATLDVVWMRKDPPVDAAYVAACQLLSLIPRPTVVLNRPDQLILKNEKLFSLEFARFIPKTRVAATPALLGKLPVVKPLHERGGRGVQRVSPASAHRVISDLTHAGRDFIQSQQFVPQALSEGNKRVLFSDGKVLGTFLRLPVPGLLTGKPIRGEEEAPATLTPREKKICATLSPVFRKLGLFFVGIDLIGEKLIEINITSPAGIPELDALYGGNHAAKVIDALTRRFFPGKR